MQTPRSCFVLVVVSLLAAALVSAAAQDEYNSGIVWPEPKVIDPGSPGGMPSDAIVLFDGHDLSQWNNGDNWEVTDDVAISRKTSISTKQPFGDCQLHIEFATPVEVRGSGQGRGNSGVHMMGRYEIQILDSFENKTYFDGQCGALYKQQTPIVNASRRPGEWQSFDILFEAPRFGDDGSVERPALATVLHNGVLIHHHVALEGTTSYREAPKYTNHAAKLPISLQWHGNPVRFRNIWVRESVQPLEGRKP